MTFGYVRMKNASKEHPLVQRIRQRIVKFLVCIPILFNLSGCVYLVVGGIGALGGYIVSPDTVEGITENDAMTVWDSAVEVVSIMGLIQEQQEEAGIIQAKINKANVTVTVVSINETTTKVTVKARKAYMPRISTAQDVYVKVMSFVNE